MVDWGVIRAGVWRAKRGEIKGLEGLLKLQDFYILNDAKSQMLDSDNKFHRYLYKITNKMQCHDMVKSQSIHFDRVRRLQLNSVKDNKIVQDHWNIFHALQEHNEKRIEEVITHHLTRFQVTEEEIRSTYPEFFKK